MLREHSTHSRVNGEVVVGVLREHSTHSRVNCPARAVRAPARAVRRRGGPAPRAAPTLRIRVRVLVRVLVRVRDGHAALARAALARAALARARGGAAVRGGAVVAVDEELAVHGDGPRHLRALARGG